MAIECQHGDPGEEHGSPHQTAQVGRKESRRKSSIQRAQFKHGQPFHPLRVFFREGCSYLRMELLEGETSAKLYRAKGLGRMW